MTKILALTLVTSLMLPITSPPPASVYDPPGTVMGVKYPSHGTPALMIGVVNSWRAYERTATPGQISACTRRASMAYPRCLTQVRTETRLP